MSLKGIKFTLEIDGQSPDTFAVVSFWLKQSYSAPFRLDIDVASTSFNHEPSELLEKNATLTLWQGSEILRKITGVVASFGMKKNNQWQMQYHLSIQPPLWRCDLRRNFRTFQQQDIHTITSMLLYENGITDWAASFNSAHPPREFCVQYGESDLAFLCRLWAEEGIFFYEHSDNNSPVNKLKLCDDNTDLYPLANPVIFNPNENEDATPEHINEFHYNATVRPSSVISKDYTFKVPGWKGEFDVPGDNLNGQFTQYEAYDYPGRFKDEQHGRDFTNYQLDGLRNNAETANGSVSIPAKRPIHF